MKDKTYRVWMDNSYSIEIKARRIETVTINDKPIKIKFLDDHDYLLAEFYCNKLAGWVEVKGDTE